MAGECGGAAAPTARRRLALTGPPPPDPPFPARLQWLSKNPTCPMCRERILPEEEEVEECCPMPGSPTRASARPSLAHLANLRQVGLRQLHSQSLAGRHLAHRLSVGSHQQPAILIVLRPR